MEARGAESAAQGGLLRNRSFKSKLLVRSQAIRESQSPPRTVSPAPAQSPRPAAAAAPAVSAEGSWRRADARRSASDSTVSSGGAREPAHRVDVQISTGPRAADGDGPRFACVCGRRARSCHHCRGRRRGGGACPSKQDSGVGCSQECPDCIPSPDILVSPADEPPEPPEPTASPARPKSEDGDPDICRNSEKKERIPKISTLGRTDSEEKKELTPEQLALFLRDTLNKSMKDRLSLLKIERDLISLVNDPGRCVARFPSVTSYGRMLVHRCAQLFQLKHTLDHANKNTVLVSKTGTCGGRVPSTGFRQWCSAVFPPSPQRQSDAAQAKSILKRDAHSFDDAMSGGGGGGAGGGGGGAGARSKSFEQREEEYERVRRRIFSSEEGGVEGSTWPWLATAPVRLLAPQSGRHSRLLKVQSLEGRGPPDKPAAAEAGEAGRAGAPRGAVSKSHSFGGYGRDEQRPRILSRQGDLASSSWRLSPSSSGYKTLSFRSTDSATPSPTGGVSPEPAAAGGGGSGGGGGGGVGGGGALVWAVTDLAAVPAGAVLLHPQTGCPLTNADGSVYHYDPARPPLLPAADSAPAAPAAATADPAADDTETDHKVEKRRGRLEKQNSFIDPDCECQAAGHPRGRCCGCCEAKSRIDWSYQCLHSDREVEPRSAPQQPAAPAADRDSAPAEPECGRQGALCAQAQCEPAVAEGAADVSYQYASDYGPDGSSNMVHYAMHYYGHPSYAIGEEMAVQAVPPHAVHAVAPPGYVHETSPAHALQSHLTAAAYDSALRQQQLVLNGIMFQPKVNQLGYPYTNHCRMEQPLQPQPQVYVAPAHAQLDGAPAPRDPQPDVGPAAAAAALHCLAARHRSYGVAYAPQLEAMLPPASYALPAAPPAPAHLHAYQYAAAPGAWLSWSPPPEPPLAYHAAALAYPPPYLAYPPHPPHGPHRALYAAPAHDALAPIAHMHHAVQFESPKPEAEELKGFPEHQWRAGARSGAGAAVTGGGSGGGEAELADKIRQIRQQMSRLGGLQAARDRSSFEGPGAASRSGTPRAQRPGGGGGGILGDYPTGTIHQPPGGGSGRDVSQLTPAARAIVESLLSKQAHAPPTPPAPHHAAAYQPDGSRRRRERTQAEAARAQAEAGRWRDGRGRGQHAEATAGGGADPPPPHQLGRPYVFRQVSAGGWCRRSPAPQQPAGFNPRYGPRRPAPDTRRR